MSHLAILKALLLITFCANLSKTDATKGKVAYKAHDAGVPCESPIYCYGSLLHTVQTMGLFNDSKDFVDQPVKKEFTVQQVLKAFDRLKRQNAGNLSKESVLKFVDRHFVDAELADNARRCPLLDWKNVTEGGLPVYHNISDVKLQELALHIHEKWLDLARSMADTGARPLVGEDGQGVLEADLPDSLVSLPYPAIVSGGRFREANYWDSYWIVQGLLVSKLTDTARGVILNFADLIDRMGFVPAGNRVYYGRRSAPPVLALMVDSYRRNPHVTVGQGKKLVQETLPALEREYRWWMEQRNVTVRSADGQLQAILNVYRAGLLAAPMTHPRPEFYLQDVHRASNLSDPSSWDKLYRNGAAASESTWSSSSRWTDVEVEDIVPVDLNAFLCAYERQMAEFYHSTGNEKMAEEFQDLAKIRADAIHAFLWNDTVKMWRDYDVRAQKQRPGFYLSHIAPIFAHCSGKVNITSTDFLQAVFKSADLKEATKYPGGIPASDATTPSGLQWDYPNAFAPLQLMLVEGFAGEEKFRDATLSWAQKFMSSIYRGYEADKELYDRYDVSRVAEKGTGEEYEAQGGFGWTNGVALRLMELFPQDLNGAATHFATLSVLCMSLLSLFIFF